MKFSFLPSSMTSTAAFLTLLPTVLVGVVSATTNITAVMECQQDPNCQTDICNLLLDVDVDVDVDGDGGGGGGGHGGGGVCQPNESCDQLLAYPWYSCHLTDDTTLQETGSCNECGLNTDCHIKNDITWCNCYGMVIDHGMDCIVETETAENDDQLGVQQTSSTNHNHHQPTSTTTTTTITTCEDDTCHGEGSVCVIEMGTVLCKCDDGSIVLAEEHCDDSSNAAATGTDGGGGGGGGDGDGGDDNNNTGPSLRKLGSTSTTKAKKMFSRDVVEGKKIASSSSSSSLRGEVDLSKNVVGGQGSGLLRTTESESKSNGEEDNNRPTTTTTTSTTTRGRRDLRELMSRRFKELTHLPQHERHLKKHAELYDELGNKFKAKTFKAKTVESRVRLSKAGPGYRRRLSDEDDHDDEDDHLGLDDIESMIEKIHCYPGKPIASVSIEFTKALDPEMMHLLFPVGSTLVIDAAVFGKCDLGASVKKTFGISSDIQLRQKQDDGFLIVKSIRVTDEDGLSVLVSGKASTWYSQFEHYHVHMEAIQDVIVHDEGNENENEGRELISDACSDGGLVIGTSDRDSLLGQWATFKQNQFCDYLASRNEFADMMNDVCKGFMTFDFDFCVNTKDTGVAAITIDWDIFNPTEFKFNVDLVLFLSLVLMLLDLIIMLLNEYFVVPLLHITDNLVFFEPINKRTPDDKGCQSFGVHGRNRDHCHGDDYGKEYDGVGWLQPYEVCYECNMCKLGGQAWLGCPRKIGLRFEECLPTDKDSNQVFEFLDAGFLKHRQSGKCVQFLADSPVELVPCVHKGAVLQISTGQAYFEAVPNQRFQMHFSSFPSMFVSNNDHTTLVPEASGYFNFKDEDEQLVLNAVDTTTTQYQKHSPGCVVGANLVPTTVGCTDYNAAVAQCKQICDDNNECAGFEFTPESDTTTLTECQCRPQSSNDWTESCGVTYGWDYYEPTQITGTNSIVYMSDRNEQDRMLLDSTDFMLVSSHAVVSKGHLESKAFPNKCIYETGANINDPPQLQIGDCWYGFSHFQWTLFADGTLMNIYTGRFLTPRDDGLGVSMNRPYDDWREKIGVGWLRDGQPQDRTTVLPNESFRLKTVMLDGTEMPDGTVRVDGTEKCLRASPDSGIDMVDCHSSEMNTIFEFTEQDISIETCYDEECCDRATGGHRLGRRFEDDSEEGPFGCVLNIDINNVRQADKSNELNPVVSWRGISNQSPISNLRQERINEYYAMAANRNEWFRIGEPVNTREPIHSGLFVSKFGTESGKFLLESCLTTNYHNGTGFELHYGPCRGGHDQVFTFYSSGELANLNSDRCVVARNEQVLSLEKCNRNENPQGLWSAIDATEYSNDIGDAIKFRNQKWDNLYIGKNSGGGNKAGLSSGSDSNTVSNFVFKEHLCYIFDETDCASTASDFSMEFSSIDSGIEPRGCFVKKSEQRVYFNGNGLDASDNSRNLAAVENRIMSHDEMRLRAPKETVNQDDIQTVHINYFKVVIQPDNFPQELSWSITGVGGSTLAHGNNYWGWAGKIITEIQGDDCYTFTIDDSYGDGICCSYGEGYYNIYKGGDVIASGGSYGSSETVQFGNGCNDVAPTSFDVCSM